MTIAEQHIEKITYQHVKGVWNKGVSPKIIASAFNLPRKKVKEIIQKIKEESPQ
jgi:hypothetical protein